MRVLVTGASGQVGVELVANLHERSASARAGKGHDVIAASRDELDVANRDAVLSTIIAIEPDVVIHAGAFTAVDRCESEAEKAFAVNAFGTRNVQEAARAVGAHVVYLSTDYVFDGTLERPYVEWDTPNPQSIYGQSKLGGEAELDEASAIVRTSWVCGRSGANMVKTVLRLARESDGPLRFVDDQHGSPTLAHDLAQVVVDLAVSRRPGIFHVTNSGATTWFGFARAVVEFSGGDVGRVEPIATSDLDRARYPARRPANSRLDNAALRMSGMDPMPEWGASVQKLVAELTR